MKKLEIQKRVLQNGKPLDLDDFTWDENSRTFSTSESYLVLDFKDINSCSFITGYECTFDTGSYCSFNTGFDCTFKTGSYCSFITGYGCTFTTSHDCTFDTEFDCSFNTGSYCTFKTGSDCTFDTLSDCTFTVGEDCVIVRRGIFLEIIQPELNKTIKLNGCGEKGFSIIEEEKISIELTKEQLEKIKHLI
jgi:hypothetical protein